MSNVNAVSVSTPPVGNPEVTSGGHAPAATERESARQAYSASKDGRANGAKPDRELLEQLAQEVNESISSVTSLSFRVDKDLDRVVVKVVDTSNDQVIRQIPSENMVDLVKRMRDLQGMLFNATA